MDATKEQLDQTQFKFVFVLTLLVVLVVYALFDKFVLDPRAVSQAQKIMKEDYEDQVTEMEMDYKLQLSTLQDRVNNETSLKISKLEAKLGKTERLLAKTERDLNRLKNDLATQRELAKDALNQVKTAQELRSKATAEAKRLRFEYKTAKQDSETLFIQYKALLDQRTVLFDSVVKQLVLLKKKAPKKTPKDYLARIQRLIQRIRDVEKITPGVKKPK